MARRRVLPPLDASSGFFPWLKGDVSPSTDPVSHQHRSLQSVLRGLRVPVTALHDDIRYSMTDVRFPAADDRVLGGYSDRVSPDPIRETPEGVEIDVLVVPNASRSGVVGPHGSRIKIRVASPPEKNKANAAVLQLVRDVTGVRKVEITRGRTGRHKTVLLQGAASDAVRHKLLPDV